MEPVVHLRGAVTLLGRFPALAGVDLDVAAGEIVLLRGPERRRQDHPAAPVRRPPARRARRGARARATTSPTAARPVPCAAGSACSATPPASTTTSPWPTTCASGAGPPAPHRPTSTARSRACGLDGRLAGLAVASLSAGQRRRTSLACLLARRPELWLLDEPHAGLDQDGPRPARRARAPGRRAPGPPCCCPPTSSTGPRRSPTASSRSPAAPPTSPTGGRRHPTRSPSLFRDAALVAGKDLRIELRSQVTAPAGGALRRARADPLRRRPRPRPRHPRPGQPGLFWVAVLFCALLAIQRAFTIEAADGGRDALRLSGLDPAGIFLGKAAAIVVQLRGPRGRARRRRGRDLRRRGHRRGRCWSPPAGPRPRGSPPPVPSTACSPPASASARRCSRSCSCRCSSPVLIGATKAFEAALGGAAADGWPWFGLLVAFALLYLDLRHPRLRHPPGGILMSPPHPSTSSPRHPRARRRSRWPGWRSCSATRSCGARPTSPRRTPCG